MSGKTIFAHRGISSLAPENTLSAFKLCAEHQVTWFECDVDIMQDGTIIVCHDSTLDRCSDHQGLLYPLSYADLAKVDAGSWFDKKYANERIPTLDQLIQLMNTHQLSANIELKSCESNAKAAHKLVQGVANALDKLDPACQTIISSFNFLLLAEIKRIRPQTTVCCLFEHHTLYNDWHVVMEWVGAECIHPEDKGLTKEKVQQFKEKGYKVHVWTVNSRARANELFNWGVDGIFTDYAHLFI